MAYCPECGSEVAEIDVFCPFCGISLQPIVVENNEDDALSSTVMIPHSEIEANEKLGNSENIRAETIEKNSDDSEKQENTGNYSNNITEENIEIKTDAVEIPVVEKLLSKDEEDKTSESEIESEIKTPFDKLSEVDAEKSTDAETESSMMNYEESEIKEIPSAEEPETTPDEIKNTAEEPDFTATIPYMSADLAKAQKAEIAKKDASDDRFSTFESEDESSPALDKKFPKPDEELPEAVCPPPKFDSVRIMESSNDKLEIAKNKSEQSAAAKLQTESPSEAITQLPEQQNKSRSNTTPNIGLGETDGASRAKLKPLDEGTVLNDRYEIVRKIGGGGMGAVYLASDKNLGGVLRAVKEMVQSYIEGEQQEKAINDFKRESLLLSTLDHPAIPTIYDYFYDDKEGRFYLVMKYISGGDLAARIRSAPEGRIDEKSVADWGIQIADVLEYLHNREMPIVYRDLKPANIMIDGNSGRVMLIDFGIARFINKEEKGVTAVGTMGYAPPELFSGNVEPRSDIYSLGSTMFHLLTGADPQSNPLLIFDFQKHPRPRQINPQLSDQMEKILMRSVEYNAGQRFETAAEMCRALEEHRKNLNENKVTYGIRETSLPVGLSEQAVFCGFCGQKIVATDMFCAFCGAKQPLAQQSVGGENYAPQPLTAKILIIGTNELETPAYRIEKDENLVGRRDPMSNIFPEVDLSKFDPQTKISRRHARIWREGSKFMVEDLGSSNGTVVMPVVKDTVRLMPHQPYPLANGDKLRLGDTTLHFIIG